MTSTKPKSKTGIKLIAAFEATKGISALITGFGLLSLVHKDLQVFIQKYVDLFHIDAHKPVFAWALVHLMNIRHDQVLAAGLIAILYASLRLLEAYGLWFARRWGEKLAIFSGLIYLPVELIEIFKGFTWIKLSVIILNLVIVLYMTQNLRKTKLEHDGISY